MTIIPKGLRLEVLDLQERDPEFEDSTLCLRALTVRGLWCRYGGVRIRGTVVTKALTLYVVVGLGFRV